jgi:hypothetical protein
MLMRRKSVLVHLALAALMPFLIAWTYPSASSGATPIANEIERGTAAMPPTFPPATSGDSVIATYTFPDVSLAAVENAALPGTVANDRKFFFGGFGSDLWHGPNDAPNEFWMITDRGPNGQIMVGDENRRTFPVPDFDPAIVHVFIDGDTPRIDKVIPIVGQSGTPVTGMSNLERDEIPYDYSAQNRLPFNQNGLDTEGIVRTASGDFWLVEEYGPSIVHVDAAGKVIKRYVPAGLNYTDTDYPVDKTLPAAFGNRRQNRGFEGVTLGADGKTLYMVLQSPLYNPDKKTGDASRNTRILAFDITTEQPVAEYVYRFSTPAEFNGGSGIKQNDLGSSVIRTVNETTLLIEERIDVIAKFFLIDLTQATNILGTQWDDPRAAPSLESLADPAANGITVLPKTLALDLSSFSGMPNKLEGLAILDRNTVVISNDNDFQIGDVDADGNNTTSGSQTKLFVIHLAMPLPLP